MSATESTASGVQRRVTEADKRDQYVGNPPRGEFARDRARVLHSSAFRRLADKTQVVVPGEDDFPRTRLTHSLEVAQLAREMGAALGCDPDVTDTAGLAHDLGHPPFGHTGEDALDAVASSIGGFEGNAQTLRILTRLEPKVLDATGESAGLNLTRAVLDATTKYPWPRQAGRRKFGVYADDLAAFDWIRAGAEPDRRCLEAQVMDWADDVAYSVHDLEDGVNAGLIRIGTIDAATRETLCRIAAEVYSTVPGERLAPMLDDLLQLPSIRELAGFDRSFQALAAAKRTTSELTGRFTGAAVAATRNTAGEGTLSRYAADLVVPERVAAECALLKALAAHFVMDRPIARRRRDDQQRVLTELVGALVEVGPAVLDPPAAAAWHAAADEAARLRVVVDQVAQLTDSAATAWHQRVTSAARSPRTFVSALDALATEQSRPDADDLETIPTEQLIARLVEHESSAVRALADVMHPLARAADAVAERMRAGGRLVYVGAGTPGRLATVDAAECVPTFGLAPGLVVAVMAGGTIASTQAVEGAEDNRGLAEEDLARLRLTSADSLVGITASGRTPYVLAALAVARSVGALTVGITNNIGSPVAAAADIGIEINSGPEVLAGSTRLAAGTTQKIALNALSTAVMVRLGKTYRGRMVDVLATNEKLRRRSVRIVREVTGADETQAAAAIAAADDRVKVAVVMLLHGLTVAEAEAALDRAGGHIAAIDLGPVGSRRR